MTGNIDRRAFLDLLRATPAVFLLPVLTACEGGRSAFSNAARTLSADAALPQTDALTHLLRRSRFALTRDDLDAAQSLGYDAYLEAQLQTPAAANPIYLEADARYPVSLLQPPLNLPLTGMREQAARQLSERSLFLAAYSDHQLYELMVDFWTNHFNVENITGQLALHKLYDDRQVIRAHSFGRFAELLEASAKSPAMLEYLDSTKNVAEGPNENYARELMELHTLGVDGGYTEQDVKEVARCFTGWRIHPQTRVFQFNARVHDDGEKRVLGHLIAAGGGVEDGEKVLRILAEHPSTARFIALKLGRRFVSDDPPGALIDALAAEFTRSQGDIPSLLRSLFHSDAFLQARDLKFRRPLEFVAAVLRTVQADRLGFDGPELLNTLSRMGQIPHRWFPPDGYPDRSAYWLNTVALLEYWNLAATLAESPDTLGRSLFARQVADSASIADLVAALAQTLVQRSLRSSDAELLGALAMSAQPQAGDTPNQAHAALIAGLLVASPYFSLR